MHPGLLSCELGDALEAGERGVLHKSVTHAHSGIGS